MSEWDWVEAQPKGWLTSADPDQRRPGAATT